VRNRLALLGQQTRIQSFWRDVFSLSHTRALQPRLHNWWEFTPKNSTQNKNVLLQLRALGYGLLEDGDIGVGAFPEGEEVMIGCVRLGRITRHRVRTTKWETSECSSHKVQHDTSVVQ